MNVCFLPLCMINNYVSVHVLVQCILFNFQVCSCSWGFQPGCLMAWQHPLRQSEGQGCYILPYHTACKVMLTFHHLIIMVLVLLTCDRKPLLDLQDAIYVIDITCLSLYFTTHLLPISPSILFWRTIHSHIFPIIHISAIKLYGPSSPLRDLPTGYPSRKFLSRSRSR